MPRNVIGCRGLALALSVGKILLVSSTVYAACPGDRPYEVVDTLGTVLYEIEHSYVDPVDRERLIEGATRGMVAELDPHSSYLDPEEYAQFLDETEGAFAGIGIEVEFADDQLTIISVLPDSPAERGGVRAGDRIVAVDSVPVTKQGALALLRRLRGKAGTEVRLTVRRPGNANPLIIPLVRAMVEIASVEARRFDHAVAYVRLRAFQQDTTYELVSALARLTREGTIQGLLLDLRGNPGGLVSEAIGVADELLDRGLIYTARHRGQVVETVRSTAGGVLEKVKLVILVGADTASSAEIVAGAVKDRKRGIIVGEMTFGKGSVQSILDLPNQGGLLLTTLRYYSPSGRAIQAQGIVPDITVAAPAEGALREADLEGHLHTEGMVEPTETPRGSEASSAESSPAPASSRPLHRRPLGTLPANPERDVDPVLRAGYRALLDALERSQTAPD